jgi:hypothetical protein
VRLRCEGEVTQRLCRFELSGMNYDRYGPVDYVDTLLDLGGTAVNIAVCNRVFKESYRFFPSFLIPRLDLCHIQDVNKYYS